MKLFNGMISIVTACALFMMSQSASAIPYTFTQDGFSEGATITGMFAGDDLNNDGQLVFGPGSELTDFSMSFSGNSIIPAFTLTLADLWGFVYDIGTPFLGDGITGYVEGIGASSATVEYTTGQGPNMFDGAVINYATGATDGSQNLVVVNAVPEPASLLLMGIGLAGFGVASRKKKAH
jgi:hypothetical protein